MSSNDQVIKIVFEGNASGLNAAAGAAEKTLGGLSKQAGATGTALKQAGATGEAAAWQMRMIAPQITDITTGLITGQPPMMIFLQQGGQLKDIFGGVAPALRAVGKEVAGYVTPFSVGAVAVGALAFALWKAQENALQFQREMVLTGNFAALTISKVNDLAAAQSKANGRNVGDQTDTIRTLAGTGLFDSAGLAEASRAMGDYQRLTQKTAEEALANFSSIAGGAANWAADQSKSIHFLTAAQYLEIKALEDHGRASEATRLALKLFADGLESRQIPQLGYLGQAWEWVTDKAQSAGRAILAVGAPLDEAQRLTAANLKLSTSIDALQAAKSYRKSGPDLERIQAVVNAARAERDAAQIALDIGEKTRKAKAEQEAADAAEVEASRSLAATATARGLSQIEASATRTKLIYADLNASVSDLRQRDAIDAATAASRLSALKQSELGVDIAAAAQKIALLQGVKGKESELSAERERIATLRERQTAEGIAGARAAAAADIAAADAADARIEASRAKAQQFAASLEKANIRDTAAQIEDPSARLTAETAQRIKEFRQSADTLIAELRVRAEQTISSEIVSGIEAQITEITQATTTAVALANQNLSQQLKPQWQKNLDAWRDTNRQMAESYNELMDGLQKRGEDVFVKLVSTGKASLKDLFQGTLADYARASFKSSTAPEKLAAFGETLFPALGIEPKTVKGNAADMGPPALVNAAAQLTGSAVGLSDAGSGLGGAAQQLAGPALQVAGTGLQTAAGALQAAAAALQASAAGAAASGGAGLLGSLIGGGTPAAEGSAGFIGPPALASANGNAFPSAAMFAKGSAFPSAAMFATGGSFSSSAPSATATPSFTGQPMLASANGNAFPSVAKFAAGNAFPSTAMFSTGSAFPSAAMFAVGGSFSSSAPSAPSATATPGFTSQPVLASAAGNAFPSVAKFAAGNAFPSVAKFAAGGSFSSSAPSATAIPGFTGQPVLASAAGNAFPSVAKFATGGAFAGGEVLTKPTLFRFKQDNAIRLGIAGEAGPEAALPLRSGGVTASLEGRPIPSLRLARVGGLLGVDVTELLQQAKPGRFESARGFAMGEAFGITAASKWGGSRVDASGSSVPTGPMAPGTSSGTHYTAQVNQTLIFQGNGASRAELASYVPQIMRATEATVTDSMRRGARG